MGGLTGKLAGLALFTPLVLAQVNYNAEYNRICPGGSSSTPSEVEIEPGFYATHHCDLWPAANAWQATLSENDPESCVKACAGRAGCEASLWSTKLSGNPFDPEGCFAFGIDTLVQKHGFVFTTYRQDCKKQNQPTLTALTTCQQTLNQCPQSCGGGAAGGGGGGGGGGGMPASCAGLSNGQTVQVGGTKYKVTRGIKHASFSWIDFNHIGRNYQESLQRCGQNCANNPQCRLFDYNCNARWCDHYKSAGSTLNDGSMCHFVKI